MEYVNEAATSDGSMRVREPLDVLLLVLAIVAFTIGAGLLAAQQHLPALGLAAFLCGVAETNGRCGVSHIGMIAPLRSVAPGTWLRCCLGYTLFGLLTASILGLGIAAGSTAIGLTSSPFVYGSAIIIGAAIVLREIGCVEFAIPQWNRQTNREWFHEFGLPTAASMWGAHIGIGLVTVIAHGGLYLVVALAIAQSPAMGAGVVSAFWIGRVFVLWVMPAISRGSTRGDMMADTLLRSTMFRLVSGFGAGLGIAGSILALTVN